VPPKAAGRRPGQVAYRSGRPSPPRVGTIEQLRSRSLTLPVIPPKSRPGAGRPRLLHVAGAVFSSGRWLRKLILSVAAFAANIVIRGARPEVCRPSLDKRHRPSPALPTCLQSVLSFHSLDSFAKATARQSAGSCQAFVPLTKECRSRTSFVAKPRNVYGGSESNPGFRSVPPDHGRKCSKWRPWLHGWGRFTEKDTAISFLPW
jgi:hypothetical protein